MVLIFLVFALSLDSCVISLEYVQTLPRILNLALSTSCNQHTRKYPVGSVSKALRLGLDAVAVHVNLTSKYEEEMKQIASKVSEEYVKFGMPLLTICYPRSEATDGTDENYRGLKEKNLAAYIKLVIGCVEFARSIGSSVAKVPYTGNLIRLAPS